MKIAIVGSRQRDEFNYEVANIRKALFDVMHEHGLEKKDVTIISGGCKKGADRFAEYVAYDNGFKITIYHADWDTHGKAAGPIRNSMIVEDCDMVIALMAIGSKGTLDTVKKAKAAGKKVIEL